MAKTPDKPYTREQKCIMALGNRGKPKQVVERLTEAERDDLAAIWDATGQALGHPFSEAFGAFWEKHAARYNAWLEQNKATDAETERVPVRAFELVSDTTKEPESE